MRKKIKYFIFFILLFNIFLISFAQEEINEPNKSNIDKRDKENLNYIVGTTINEKTQEPLSYVLITAEDGKVLVTSDYAGNFLLPYNAKTNIFLVFKKEGFEPLSIASFDLFNRGTNPQLMPIDSRVAMKIFNNNYLGLNYFLSVVDERYVPEMDTYYKGLATFGLGANLNLIFYDKWIFNIKLLRLNYDLGRVTTTGEVFNRNDQTIDLSINYRIPLITDFLELMLRQGYYIQLLNRSTPKEETIDSIGLEQFRQNIYFGTSLGMKLFDKFVISLHGNYGPLSLINISKLDFPRNLQMFSGEAAVRWRFYGQFTANAMYRHITWFEPNRQYAQQYNGGILGISYEW